MNVEARAALSESLVSRADQAAMRLVMATGITISLLPVIGWPVALWLVIWIAFQLAEKVWVRRRIAAGSLTEAAPWGLAFIFVNGAWFGVVALQALVTGHPWTEVAGVIILAGALMNAGPSTRSSTAAYVATLAPIIPYIFAMPVLAYLQKASLGEVWSIACASVLLIVASLTMRLFGVRALEGERRANAAKGEFLATVSHEIRTPLNGVLGMAQAMAVDELSNRQRARLDMLSQSGETLLLLLNDVLDFSKIEAGKLELEEAEFELTPIFHSAHALFAPLAAAKSLVCRLDIEDSAKGVYRGDGARLRQIHFNLLSNALKFTERGEVRVRLWRDGETLCVSVADTGIGIPADRVSRLFTKFDQLDASTTRRFGGSGLGLAISQMLAGLMGGAIAVESREGHGSEFRLRLPLPRLGDETGIAALARTPHGLADGARLSVLAAEDNPMNQLVLRTLLEQAGVEPVIVSNGAQALEAWGSRHWDVILMDVQMPVMDGPTAARAIRAAEAQAGLSFTPIVALTANAMSHQVAEYAAAGMDLFVAKPIKVEALFAAIEAALDRGRGTSVAA